MNEWAWQHQQRLKDVAPAPGALDVGGKQYHVPETSEWAWRRQHLKDVAAPNSPKESSPVTNATAIKNLMANANREGIQINR